MYTVQLIDVLRLDMFNEQKWWYSGETNLYHGACRGKLEGLWCNGTVKDTKWALFQVGKNYSEWSRIMFLIWFITHLDPIMCDAYGWAKFGSKMQYGPTKFMHFLPLNHWFLGINHFEPYPHRPLAYHIPASGFLPVANSRWTCMEYLKCFFGLWYLYMVSISRLVNGGMYCPARKLYCRKFVQD